jgi:hypothetical protein
MLPVSRHSAPGSPTFYTEFDGRRPKRLVIKVLGIGKPERPAE